VGGRRCCGASCHDRNHGQAWRCLLSGCIGGCVSPVSRCPEHPRWGGSTWIAPHPLGLAPVRWAPSGSEPLRLEHHSSTTRACEGARGGLQGRAQGVAQARRRSRGAAGGGGRVPPLPQRHPPRGRQPHAGAAVRQHSGVEAGARLHLVVSWLLGSAWPSGWAVHVSRVAPIQ
jgi:hypothetical protein